MTRAPKPTRPVVETAASIADADGGEIVQIKVWLLGVSPIVWRRLLIRSTCTLRELHGVIQVAMGWEGIHLYQFCLRSGRYGSSELSASSPEVTVAALRLRKGARFTYEYDLNIPWRHEIRIEDLLAPEMGKAHPVCTGGDGACPPEDCDGPAGFMAGRNAVLSMDGLEDLDTIAKGGFEACSPAEKRDRLRRHRPAAVSVQRGCELMGLSRSTFYDRSAVPLDEDELVRSIGTICDEFEMLRLSAGRGGTATPRCHRERKEAAPSHARARPAANGHA